MEHPGLQVAEPYSVGHDFFWLPQSAMQEQKMEAPDGWIRNPPGPLE